MTREEAIISLEEIKDFYGDKNKDGYAFEFVALEKEEIEALDMAIEALQEPKTIIGIDMPYGSDKGFAGIFKGKDDKLTLEEVEEIMAVKYGKWKCMADCGVTECDQCGWSIEEYVGDYNFCPNCGAKMDKE